MEKGILNHSSYEETLRSLSKYHKKIMDDVCFRFKFPNMSTNPFTALRKNVEIGFLCCALMEWEREAVFEYGKKHVFKEYYPVIFDYVKKVVISHKCEDYSCNITYFHIFPPIYYGDMICSFFVNFFEKPIFNKYFNSEPYEPFIYFDKHNDKMIVLSSLSKDQWINFLERMCT